MRHLAEQRGLSHLVETESAGTGGWHQGDPPDHRSIAIAQARGVDISWQRARQVRLADFYDFDMIFAMDRDNLRNLVRLAPHDSSADIHLFMDFVSGAARDVPDPYYGGAEDFEAVYEMLQFGCARLLDTLFSRVALP